MEPPPPPYTPTDPGTVILTPTTSQADDASLPAPSAAPSAADDEIIFTPPYTPTEATFHSRETELGRISTASATAYFDSRPAIERPPSIPNVYMITITSTTKPEHISYPDPPLSDVTEQDWATFVNYLFPNHAASTNSEVADRKFEAEMNGLRLGSEGRPDVSQVDAQLRHLRSSPQTAGVLGERLAKIDATITQWNDGFFLPRGHQIRFLEPEIRAEDEKEGMPGSWVSNDQETAGEAPEEPTRSRGYFNFLPGLEASSRGFRLGPLRADSEGFRIGKNGLVADGRGFRIGNMLVSDSNGFRLGGPRGFVADSNGVTVGGRNLGRRDDKVRDPGLERGFEGRRGRGHHNHRGRGKSGDYGRHERRGRSPSSSSSSTSSSSRSLGSESSMGSLPDYDDLKDQQLPAAKQSLLDWLNNPEQPITRETVRSIKDGIKLAKKSNYQQLDRDLKTLRTDVRSLMRKFKDAKRAQKIFRRNLKKEKLKVKKAQRRERRTARKEARRQMKGKYKENPDSPEIIPPATGVNPGNAQMPSFPYNPTDSGAAFPFDGREPWTKSPSSGISARPGMAAMHGGWPFVRGDPSSEYEGLGGPVSHSASSTNVQAVHFDSEASRKEAEALTLRSTLIGRRVDEKERSKTVGEAVKLEEEASRYRREAERLRAEVAHLDEEIARDLEDQVSGVTQR